MHTLYVNIRLQAVMLFSNWTNKPPWTPVCCPKDLHRTLGVNCRLVSLSPAAKASLQTVYLNLTSQSDTVARDRPSNLWHHSSGKIMSSHRPETGLCVCVFPLKVCVSLPFLVIKAQRDSVRKRQGNSLNFKLQIAPVRSTPSRIWL